MGHRCMSCKISTLCLVQLVIGKSNRLFERQKSGPVLEVTSCGILHSHACHDRLESHGAESTHLIPTLSQSIGIPYTSSMTPIPPITTESRGFLAIPTDS